MRVSSHWYYCPYEIKDTSTSTTQRRRSSLDGTPILRLLVRFEKGEVVLCRRSIRGCGCRRMDVKVHRSPTKEPGRSPTKGRTTVGETKRTTTKKKKNSGVLKLIHQWGVEDERGQPPMWTRRGTLDLQLEGTGENERQSDVTIGVMTEKR